MTRVHTIVLAGFLSAASLAACSTPAPPPESRLKEVTASAVAGVDPASITISDFKGGLAKTTWRAVAGGKTYLCDADERLNLPQCTLES